MEQTDVRAGSSTEKSVQNTNATTGRGLRTFAVLPYVKGVSEQIKWTLKRASIKTAFRQSQTHAKILKKQRSCSRLQLEIPGIVYKVKCKDCHFTYVGESKRSWDLRGKHSLKEIKL